MDDPLKPNASLLVKLGSIMVHAEEMIDPVEGHEFDLSALNALLADPDVKTWRKQMSRMALLPVRR